MSPPVELPTASADITDPSLWAAAFLERFEVRARDDGAHDDDPQEFMVTWFAGAINAGQIAGKNAIVKTIHQLAVDKLEAEGKWARAAAGLDDSEDTSATDRPAEGAT